ncbi:arad-like aldolase/epimerase [Amniculicola lignicola CBS 123094]|uniref:Arad-like aldolase/epimerase n=1 Tax=Amniculicola lignicola CBS 123094 TaxID=1392246 RepID=A0A6A5WPL3_9PLEO|nr:arad-like aldolase/epimerase [Amniculicola lignicola CBS 123094]
MSLDGFEWSGNPNIQLLIASNHILHQHSLVDAFGHISIRHPNHSDQYIIAGYDPGAPALISRVEHFIEYWIDGSRSVRPNAPKGYSERFIHGEIYKKYPGVNCVVHSHSEKVIPFMSAGIAIKPIFHMAGFLGGKGPPVFDVTKLYRDVPSEQYTPDMLIKCAFSGSKLAETFLNEKSGAEVPACPVVLQKKHGFTCVGETIQTAVYRAIYLQKNSAMLKEALDLAGGDPVNVTYLSEEEAQGCAKMNKLTEDKAFRLWLKEVEVNRLYRNDDGIPDSLPVGGMQDDV